MILTTKLVRKNGEFHSEILEFQTLEEYAKYEEEQRVLSLKSQLREAEKSLKQLNQIVEQQQAKNKAGEAT